MKKRCISTTLLIFLVGMQSLYSHAAGIPDTGQIICYSTSDPSDCTADTSHPRQDGSQVVVLSYTKLDAGGGDLDASALDWSCVRDNATGLVWEAKTADAGLRGVGHRYAWYDGIASRNGGEIGGTGDLESCGNTLNGQTCNTTNYLAVVNAGSYCGATDWRLPTQMELLSLVNAGGLNPAIDSGFFPNTANIPYWSGSTYAMNPLNAWGVHFGYGAAHSEAKRAANAVRLVRGVWSK